MTFSLKAEPIYEKSNEGQCQIRHSSNSEYQCSLAGSNQTELMEISKTKN